MDNLYLMRRASDLLAGVLLALLTTAVYCAMFQNGFVEYDDNRYVTDNAAVQGGLTSSGIVYAWTTFDMAHWIPLTWMSLELDTTLFGHSAQGYLVTNLILHLANVVLLYLFLRTTTGMAGCSFVAAALFAVHPLHVESVAWIAERKDVLSTFFLMLALHAYVWHARRTGVLSSLSVATAMTASLLAKPMLVTLPILLLLLDYWPLGRVKTVPVRRQWGRLLIEKLPLFLISLAFGLVTIYAQRVQGSLADLHSHSLTARFANAAGGYVWYLQKTLLPTDLTVFYPVEFGSELSGEKILPIVLMAGLTWGAFILRRTHPWLIVGWLWFLIALLPVSGLLQVGLHGTADRYSYVPHIGLFVALVWEVNFILDRWPYAFELKAGLGVMTLMFFSLLAFLQVGYWHDARTLWTHADQINSKNWMACYQLGVIETRDREWTDALGHLERSRRLEPKHTDTHIALAALYQTTGDYARAKTCCRQALALSPHDRKALLHLGSTCLALGEHEQARAAFVECQLHHAGDPAAEAGLGHVAASTRDYASALQHFQTAANMAPRDVTARVLTAAALVELQRLPEATEQLQDALKIEPGNAKLRLQLAELLERQGRRPDAIEQYETILKHDSGNPQAVAKIQQLQREIPAPQK